MNEAHKQALEALKNLLNACAELLQQDESSMQFGVFNGRIRAAAKVVAEIESAASSATEPVTMTELLEETRDTLVNVLLKIRRDAPDLSGKLMGHADNVVARVDAFLDAAPPAPSATSADARIVELEQQVSSLEDEIEELKGEAWPDWANQVIKIVRSASGYDGYDDSDGIDIPGEVQELADEYSRTFKAMETYRKERDEARATLPAAQPEAETSAEKGGGK